MAPHRLADELPDVIDIRRGEIEFHLLDEVKKGLLADPGQKSLSSMVLYDEKGLGLFEEITYLDEYYLTNAEIEGLETYANEIVNRIPHGAQVVELGSGNLRKVKILLDALERAEKAVDYYALDLSLSELNRTLAEIPIGTYEHVKCHGLHGTYDDGFAWLKESRNAQRPKCIVSLGSSIGNFSHADAAGFLWQIASSLTARDVLIIGVDGCEDSSRIYHAYNDRQGTTHAFYRNGLNQVNNLLGQKIFEQADWDVIGEFDASACRHQAFISPRKNVAAGEFSFAKGERVHLENAHKYPSERRRKLWRDAGLVLAKDFTNARRDYHINMLSPSLPDFSLAPQEYARAPAPSLEEYEELWAVWDLVTRDMVPHEELLSKPINLRNCCLFYLGHIPTFLDIHITKATDGKPTEPASFRAIFERGIDPDVENPEHCHSHSKTPDTWPAAKEIYDYQTRVRERVRAVYASGEALSNSRVSYALWIGLEHEAMHLETFLYMLLQSDKTLPPPGPKPDFKDLARKAREHAVPNSWVYVPRQHIELGQKPAAKGSLHDYFGWDNEMPIRTTSVPAFEAQARPLTNGDYARYLSEAGNDTLPASWSTQSSASDRRLDGQGDTTSAPTDSFDRFVQDKTVKTLYGPVPLALALDWPVMASYNELAGCAKWMGGRIPTLEEVQSIYAYVEKRREKDISFESPQNIPAVNGHLSNDGVEESPPQGHDDKHSGVENGVTPNPHSLFADLKGCNVSFKAFHLMPVTERGGTLAGRGAMGGVWEWTSSVLERWEGFEPMEAYPVYTADFFDGKHNILLGGSWATHPRIAGRKSFINFYQRNYPYVWGGARLVRDA